MNICIISDGNNCSVEGEMIVAPADWMGRGGSKLKSPEAGPSLEYAENSLAWMQGHEQRGERDERQCLICPVWVFMGFKRSAKNWIIECVVGRNLG